MKYINYINTETMYKLIDICSVFALDPVSVTNIISKNSIKYMSDPLNNVYITNDGLSELFSILAKHNKQQNLSALKEFINCLSRNALNEDSINRRNKQIALNV